MNTEPKWEQKLSHSELKLLYSLNVMYLKDVKLLIKAEYMMPFPCLRLCHIGRKLKVYNIKKRVIKCVKK